MITCIIPVGEINSDKSKNLEFVYQRLIDSGFEILLVIQGSSIDSYYNKFEKAKVINFFSKEHEKFNKSFLFNSCIKSNISFKNFILFLDPDVYFPFKELENQIEGDEDIIQPFSNCYYLDEFQTNEFICKREAEISNKFRKVSTLGSCALIISNKKISRIKFNEKFFNWDFEDVDLGEDLRELKVKTIDQLAVRLYSAKEFDSNIVHVFSNKEYDDATNSYLRYFKEKNVKLINCGPVDFFKNDKLKFVETAYYDRGCYLGELLESAMNECDEEDWVLYTEPGISIGENLYGDLSNCKVDYIEFFGCEVSYCGNFLRGTSSVNGFAIKKRVLKSFYLPKVFTKEKDWGKKVSDHFKNLKKINVENQLEKIIKNKIKKSEEFNENKSVLYFSPHAPDPHTSGGDRLIKILKIIKELKYNVHFFCNISKELRHSDLLRDMGIQCYTPNDGSLSFYLKQIKEKINCAFFSWYDIGSQYANVVREMFPEAKIIVDTVDVHWKRELRGFDKKEISLSLEQILKRKEEEKLVYSNADVVFVVTSDDKEEIIREVGNNSNIKILSNIHESKKSSLLNGENDILFIGNFDHAPNISAAVSSINIYKKFKKTKTYKELYNKPKLYVVGKKLPIEVENMCDNKCCVALRDVENLDDIYKKVLISISPLTWGAGIKGKICDAASRGKIILTSDVGNEGINLSNGQSGFIANNENEFVNSLEKIYKSKNLSSIAEEGKKIVQSLVSIDSAVSVLKHTLWSKPISIVIVTHNKSKDLKRCISSIVENTTYPNYRIVVYDNASEDDTRAMIKNLKKNLNVNIDYIRSKKNKYFVIPNNRVINHEKYKNSDIVLVNNDIEIISKCWLTDLYSSAYSEYSICAVGGKLISPDGFVAEAGAELYNNGEGCNIGLGKRKDDPEYDFRRYVGYCSGCLLYMRRDAIEKIGVLDEDFSPMYYEESEWQYRAHLNGLKTIYEPKVQAIHHEESFKKMKKHQVLNKKKFLKKYKNINIEKYN